MLSTSKKLEIDTRRTIERKLITLGLSQQDIATALGIDISSVRNDLDKIGEVKMVFNITNLTIKERRDLAFHHAFIEYLEAKTIVGHAIKRFDVETEIESAFTDALEVYLDIRRIMGIADGVVFTIKAMINTIDPPEYQPYRQFLWAVFGEIAHKLTRGDLLTEFHFHVCNNGILVTRDSFPTQLATFAFEDYKGLAGIPLDQTAKMVVDEGLSSLATIHENVIRLRFGLAGENPLTFEKIGIRLNMTKERIRQIEAKALRQFRHPERARRLRIFLESPFEFTRRKLNEMFTPPSPPIPPVVYEESGSKNVRDLLAQSIEDFDLSVRSYNGLKSINIETIGDLIQKTEAEMLRVKDFGRNSLNEIKDLLEPMGLCFGMKIDSGFLRKPTGEIV